MASFSSSQD